MTTPNCPACAHSWMDMDYPFLLCGLPEAGFAGIRTNAGPGDGAKSFCGEDRPKFSQHPLRNSDGSLKVIK